MLQLTVKTLDSQNHAFSCEDDITVRGFKEHIADTVSIPADSQRLIYCGRVLQDEKKLTDYDVDGKVIHLVQRAPPQSESRSSSNEGQRQNNNQGWQSGSRLHLRGHFPRNAMYLSAVSLPTEVVEGHGSPTPQLSNTLSNSRLVAARRMLNKASQLMDRLDDPSVPLHPNPTENNSSESSTQASAPGGETEQESNSSNNENNTSDVNRIAQAASEMAAAFSAAALINIRLSPGGDVGGSINVMDSIQSDENDQAHNLESESESQNAQAQGSGTPDESEPQRAEADRPEASAGDADSQNTSRRSTPHVPRPPLMAELLERLVATQDRLRPYIDRYRHLMSTDPTLTPGVSGPEGVAENQRVVDGVSECLHYLSHASHALSDIIVDMGQQPPRNLRCRPIIIHSSAILQAGIPIQVESHINFNGRPVSTNNNSTDEGNEATRPSSPSSATSDQTGNRSTSANNRPTSQSTNGQQQNQGQPSLLGLLDLSNIVQMSTEQSPQNTVDLSSSNSVDATENDQNQTNNNNSTSNNGGSGNMYMPQPFALIRDALQSVLGDRHAFQVDASGGTGGGNATSNVPFVTIVGQQMDSNAPNSGQSTQARSNIGTHPTTSTQTRSTSRPHVLHPHTPLNMGMGMGQSLDFDPYLPCNSHHIRRNPPATANSTATSQSNQPNQFSTAESNSHSQSASRSASASASTSTSTRQGPGGTSVTFTLVDHSNVARDILDNTSQGLGAMGLPLNLGELLQGSVGDNVNISFFGGGPIASEVHFTPNSDLPLAELLRSMNIRLEELTSRNFLIDLWMFLLRNVTFGSLMQLTLGQTTPLVSLRRPLREFLEHSFPDTPQETLQERVVEQIILLHRPYMQNLVIPEEEAAGRPVDVPATLEAMLRRFCFDFLKLLFNNDLDNATFAQEAFALGSKLEDQSSAVLQSILEGGQTALEAITSRFLARLTEGIPSLFQQTFLGMLSQRVHAYATRQTGMSQDEINSLLVFKDERPSAPPAEDPPAPAPIPERTRPRASAIRKPEVEPEPEPQAQAQALPTQQQQPPAKSEFKKTEEMKEVKPEFSLPMDTEKSENKIAGFVDLAADEDIPETFPGAENLPPEWVPIIARDSIRQRRQVQIDALNGGPIPFSDAYLSSMPSKRRKLIEQQKPQLLMSPTPTSTAIAASVERLVREGISHSHVDEVEGSANAVANAPTVRSAFGHAIRDCLHPSRFRTPDFPNSRRFPNATKVFANGEQDDETPSAASSSSK